MEGVDSSGIFYLHYKERQGLDGLILEPFRLAIHFGDKQIKWHKAFLYFPLDTPHKQLHVEDHYEDVGSIVIFLDELYIDPIKPNQFSIYLPLVLARIEKLAKGSKHTHNYIDEIEQFIVSLNDLEILLKTNLRRIYEWRD
ncbi:hypothetical protein OB236_38510 [Paenibacillus sp. WQ 127069]|uniref:AraC family transcriptional regulator n=1 Tax=Paenibacillus baimaensis TaxID=2982185 RepID=A0ABT2UTP3_9BACL|nr:hypothetical protein [Paenibacillus sp. WQ 127069]MCU6798035.1 hypothetical protein [Paenibacillus sp. WQ 127069]